MNTTNRINFKISINNQDTKAEIEVRLSDHYAVNGHEDFAVTGCFWTAGKPRTDKYLEMCGCCHAEIGQILPELSPLINLHLCDATGSPMHAAANGFYFLENNTKEEFCSYMRCDEKTYLFLAQAEDQKHFHYLLQVSGLPEQWENEARAGIALIESLYAKYVGERVKFKSEATRRNFKPLPATESALIAQRIKDGYYSKGAITERKEKALKLAIEVAKEKAKVNMLSETAESARKCDLKIFLIDFFQHPEPNYIFYNHTSELHLGFHSGTYSAQYTDEQISDLWDAIRQSGHLNFVGKVCRYKSR